MREKKQFQDPENGWGSNLRNLISRFLKLLLGKDYIFYTPNAVLTPKTSCL